MLSPHLQREWHPDNNVLLGGRVVKPQSRFRVKWECKNCPARKPHIFSTTVQSRTKGSRCPYCTGQRVCVHNSLATIAPMVARFWNEDRNADTPEETLAGSHYRAEWRCPDCQFKWQAMVAGRVNNSFGCPECSQLYKQQRQKQATFEAAQHQLLSEWD